MNFDSVITLLPPSLPPFRPAPLLSASPPIPFLPFHLPQPLFNLGNPLLPFTANYEIPYTRLFERHPNKQSAATVIPQKKTKKTLKHDIPLASLHSIGVFFFIFRIFFIFSHLRVGSLRSHEHPPHLHQR